MTRRERIRRWLVSTRRGESLSQELARCRAADIDRAALGTQGAFLDNLAAGIDPSRRWDAQIWESMSRKGK